MRNVGRVDSQQWLRVAHCGKPSISAARHHRGVFHFVQTSLVGMNRFVRPASQHLCVLQQDRSHRVTSGSACFLLCLISTGARLGSLPTSVSCCILFDFDFSKARLPCSQMIEILSSFRSRSLLQSSSSRRGLPPYTQIPSIETSSFKWLVSISARNRPHRRHPFSALKCISELSP
jgi:hypothetical protein